MLINNENNFRMVAHFMYITDLYIYIYIYTISYTIRYMFTRTYM